MSLQIYQIRFISLPNDKLRVTQIESICRSQVKRDVKGLNCHDGLDNIVGKGENASYQHFLLLRRCLLMFVKGIPSQGR